MAICHYPVISGQPCYHGTGCRQRLHLCDAANDAHAHCNPEFEKDLRAARAEYALLKGLPVTPVAAVPQASRHIYRLDGTPATTQTRGIVIQSNRKTIRTGF